jgi:hypothetical protein
MKKIPKIAKTRPLSKIDINGCIKWQLVVFVLLLISCGKPDQPPLTEKETFFVNHLGSKFKAKVTREIDVMILGRFYEKGKRGGY